MFLVGNRQSEVFQRATHRDVTAFINATAPGFDPKANPMQQLGMIVENKTSLFNLTAMPVTQGATVWKQDDTCEPLITKDIGTLHRILERLGRRTAAANSEKVAHMSFDDQKELFNSEDLIAEAVGIPHKLQLNFVAASEGQKDDIEAVPFPKLKEFILLLNMKLDEIGGEVRSATIVHQSAMSAFDYYSLQTESQITGHRFTFGDVLKRKGYNLLKNTVFAPLVTGPTLKKTLH